MCRQHDTKVRRISTEKRHTCKNNAVQFPLLSTARKSHNSSASGMRILKLGEGRQPQNGVRYDHLPSSSTPNDVTYLRRYRFVFSLASQERSGRLQLTKQKTLTVYHSLRHNWLSRWLKMRINTEVKWRNGCVINTFHMCVLFCWHFKQQTMSVFCIGLIKNIYI